jgi:hypothetical protein
MKEFIFGCHDAAEWLINKEYVVRKSSPTEDQSKAFVVTIMNTATL